MGDFQVCSVLIPDPLNSLLLRIYHQGPALTVCQDSGIFGGHSVTGQPLVIPGGNGGVIRQRGNQVQAFGYWDANLENQS